MKFRDNFCNFNSKMPLSELYRSINGKNESPQQKLADVSYIPNDEFVELVWEKGQIMMQGQSSKTKKTPVSSNFQFQTPKIQGKYGLFDVQMPEMGLNEEDDLVPWLDYSLDDYNSNLLTELSGVTNQVTDQSKTRQVTSFPDPTVKTKAHSYRDPLVNLEKAVQKQDSVLPNSTSKVLNFSHFSRPAAKAKAMTMTNAKASVQNQGPQKETGEVGLVSKAVDEPNCVDNCCNDVNGGSETVKSNEPVGVTSSVCSGNSGERASNDLTKNRKRSFRDVEDFECQSQDAEEESLGTKTTAGSRGGSGSKRSRAAEVHNLSERRRRDRINEKMRALQELIPNCNKVDKASMLDEAIEYLKTLQLQVQIMSMGTGLCMPSMMFPTGMQHMHPHFSPMGMGLGMGYGMGMEMNGGPHMFPFSPNAQGSRHSVHSPSIYGPMLLPQPPMPVIPSVQQMATRVEVSGVGLSPNKNPHESQVANKSVNQSTLDNKNDKVLEAGCSTRGVD